MKFCRAAGYSSRIETCETEKITEDRINNWPLEKYTWATKTTNAWKVYLVLSHTTNTVIYYNHSFIESESIKCKWVLSLSLLGFTVTTIAEMSKNGCTDSNTHVTIVTCPIIFTDDASSNDQVLLIHTAMPLGYIQLCIRITLEFVSKEVINQSPWTPPLLPRYRASA